MAVQGWSSHTIWLPVCLATELIHILGSDSSLCTVDNTVTPLSHLMDVSRDRRGHFGRKTI